MSDIVLEYNCYEIYKFINAINNYVDEIDFSFNEDGLRLNIMDASRIMLAEVTQPYETFLEHNGASFKQGLDLKDLKELLRTKKGDMKEVKLMFSKNKDDISIEKYSPKLRNKAMFTLAVIENNNEDMPIENLNAIGYPNKSVFEIRYLNDYLYEAGRLSEIVKTIIDEEGFHFKEEGQMGMLDYIIKKERCSDCYGNVANSYSLTYLNALKPLLEILPKDNLISFSLKTDHPIRIDIDIKSLGVHMVIFLAPRVTEDDFEYEDDMDEF